MLDQMRPARPADDPLPFDRIVHAYSTQIRRLASRGRSADAIANLLVTALTEMGHAEAAAAANFRPQIELLVRDVRRAGG